MMVGRFVASCVGVFLMKVLCANTKVQNMGHLDTFKENECTWKHDNLENLRSK